MTLYSFIFVKQINTIFARRTPLLLPMTLYAQRDRFTLQWHSVHTRIFWSIPEFAALDHLPSTAFLPSRDTGGGRVRRSRLLDRPARERADRAGPADSADPAGSYHRYDSDIDNDIMIIIVSILYHYSYYTSIGSIRFSLDSVLWLVAVATTVGCIEYSLLLLPLLPPARLSPSADGAWEWLGGSPAVNYTNWVAGEPNNGAVTD